MKKFAVGLALAAALGLAQAAPIVYTGTLSNGVTAYDDVPLESYADPTQWDYWRISGTVGDVVSILVNRASDQMDPAVILYRGIGGDTDGLGFLTGTDSDDGLLVFQTEDDDTGGASPYGGQFNDAAILSFALPATGNYTLAVFDVLGCFEADAFCSNGDGPWTYEIVARGFTDSSVPVPGSVALLAAGLLGAGVAVRRKARRQAARAG